MKIQSPFGQRRRAVLMTLALAVGMPGVAISGDFPSKPITLVVAGPPAGGTDLLARTIAAEMSSSLGQTVIVDNRPGAGGIIGTKSVAKAAPDGYTLLMGHVATNAIVPSLIKPKPYDAIKDFVPVGMVGTAPDILVVPANSPIKSVRDLLASASSTPGGLTYGSPGIGLPQHIAGFALSKASGVPMLHIPYKGSAPAITDLIGGRITTMFVTPGAAVPYLKSGQLRALAQTSGQRSRLFPDLPTFVELGLPAVEEVGWFGIFAPANTPPDVVQTLNRELSRAVAKPEIRAKMEAMYLEPAADTSSQAFAAFQAKEVRNWAKVIKDLGVRAE